MGFDAGPTAPEPTAVLFSDSFESVASESAWATPWDPNTTARVTQNVFSGDGALRVTGDFGNDQSFMAVDLPYPDAQNTFVRVYAYVEGIDSASRFILLELQSFGTPGKVGLDLSGPLGKSLVLFSSHASPEKASFVTATMLFKQWVCLELRVLVSEQSGELQLWVDGEDQGTTGGFPTAPSGKAVNHLDFGFWQYIGNVPSAILYDDFVVSSQRVGCQ
jgi:hypothetical protein